MSLPLGSAAVDRSPRSCTSKKHEQTPGCKRAHARRRQTCVPGAGGRHRGDLTPLMDIPRPRRGALSAGWQLFGGGGAHVLAPGASLSPPPRLRIASHNLAEAIRGGAGAGLEGNDRFLWLCFCVCKRYRQKINKKKKRCLSHDTGIQAPVNGDR